MWYICVEGWSVIGCWGGMLFGVFFVCVGVDM